MTSFAHPDGNASQRKPAGVEPQVDDLDRVASPLPRAYPPRIPHPAERRLERNVQTFRGESIDSPQYKPSRSDRRKPGITGRACARDEVRVPKMEDSCVLWQVPLRAAVFPAPFGPATTMQRGRRFGLDIRITADSHESDNRPYTIRLDHQGDLDSLPVQHRAVPEGGVEEACPHHQAGSPTDGAAFSRRVETAETARSPGDHCRSGIRAPDHRALRSQSAGAAHRSRGRTQRLKAMSLPDQLPGRCRLLRRSLEPRARSGSRCGQWGSPRRLCPIGS
jgi:hypothetical protein